MLREFRPSDIRAMVALFRRSVHETAAAHYEPEQLAAWAPNASSPRWVGRLPNDAVFVYELDNQITGFVAVESSGHVDLLYVDPEYQRRGIATKLFDRVRVWAEASGLARMSTEASVTVRPFFERCGFTVVREQIVQPDGVAMRNFWMELLL